MRQSQAIALAALVVAASLLLAIVSWVPSHSASTPFAATPTMSDDAPKASQAAHHHHHVNTALHMVGGKGAEQPIADETKQVRG